MPISFSFCSYNISYYTIPKGTILYRSASTICPYKNAYLHRKECPDTGKKGIYFSTYILQSLGMAIEYEEDLELGVFETTGPIKVMFGKYAFRNIHPERYLKDDGSFIRNVKVQKDENVSHMDHTHPILDFEKHVRFDKELNDKNGEVFLATTDDLKKVKMVKTFRFSVNDLKEFLEKVKKTNGCIPLTNNTLYLRSGILHPLECEKHVNKTRKKKEKKEKKEKMSEKK